MLQLRNASIPSFSVDQIAIGMLYLQMSSMAYLIAEGGPVIQPAEQVHRRSTHHLSIYRENCRVQTPD